MKKLLLILSFTLNIFGYSGYYAPYEGTKCITQGWSGGYSHGVTDGELYTAGKELAYAIDISGSFNVLAVKDGEIIKTGVHSGFGNYIIIKHDDGLFSQYTHLKTVSIFSGVVKKGSVIGISGNTGSYSGGNHLHLQFSIKEALITDKASSRKVDFNGFNIASINTLNSLACGTSQMKTSNNKEYIELKVTRSAATKLILDKFDISSKNAGFNASRFGESITIPSDVYTYTLNYNYIVTAYNRGISRGSNSTFRPNDDISLAEFLIMIIRAIPIPTNNHNYNSYDYDYGEWYYTYAKTAYNANLIEQKSYSFNDPISEALANDILNKAYYYFKGAKSGISIYAKWEKEYTDIDLYLYSIYDGDGTEIEYDSSHIVSNMDNLKSSGGIVYWNKHSSDWGANLDYDSWGGNGSQPWTGAGEERITVDSQMVRRPGRYDIIFCYYDWLAYENPLDVNIEWWGIKRGKNINTGGVNFDTNIKKGKCLYSGTLNTK